MNKADKEIAARKYCEVMGLNPDEMVGHGAEPDANGIVPAVWIHSPRWMTIVKAVEHHHAMEIAFSHLRVVHRES